MSIQIVKDVIWFDYKGDEVAWNGKQYISLLCGGGFDTLEDLDKFWEEYYNEMEKEKYKDPWTSEGYESDFTIKDHKDSWDHTPS